MRVCGMMSGTSLDGLDLAIVDFSMQPDRLQFEVKKFVTVPYPEELRQELLRLMDAQAPLNRVSAMNMYLGDLYARLLKESLHESDIQLESIDLISSHGQTIWHEPFVKGDAPFTHPNTMQIGDIAVLAERAGIPVIGDFRTRDMAAGGQGAPLVPFADHYLFQSDTEGRVLVNIGGIANITVLPPGDSGLDVIAYDTGPGNMIIDSFVSKHSAGAVSYDADGGFAEKGTVDKTFLHQLLSEPYFSAQPPKSTGRELFGAAYAERVWTEMEQQGMADEDKIATVTMLTAHTLADEITRHHDKYRLKTVIVSGGGVHNKTLLTFLKDLLPEGLEVMTSAEVGIDPDAKEAFVFALLGYLGFQRLPNSLPSATGAKRQTVMGKIAY
ncbi:anhydro-N-acetylmuramic acid kinase [Sporosarcina sp. NCCP-2222]|uniref:anhydro-N-acetylmuramic acid kinase n=1 Tax=Sporosarcina sp. NCCP-2222 TaxID=2935073 RepID=UPI002080F4D4|nr:anhydro-N-acetylmuramic acid kinase [Sporosarcina sp. NCCP-2222]GKV56843.1 anhydro-N-acetylmuramic acid kinase [Sporosarcina sp. NCCP-2222]